MAASVAHLFDGIAYISATFNCKIFDESSSVLTSMIWDGHFQ